MSGATLRVIGESLLLSSDVSVLMIIPPNYGSIPNYLRVLSFRILKQFVQALFEDIELI